MARIVLLVNIILFSLSWTAAIVSSDVDVTSPNAESSVISKSSSSSDAGSLSSSGSESLDSPVASSRKRAHAICHKGKKKSSCPKHEVRTKCIQAYCKPQKCSEKGRDIPCPAIAGPCEKGCVCESGYLRNCKGRCIPENRCPPAGKCQVNEEYSDCIQGVCRALNCTQKGKPIACAGIAEGSCEKGCICSPGFLRDEDGNCIPDDQCPSPKCDGQNEVLAECPNGCDPINCPESLHAEQERLAGCNSNAACLPPDCRCRTDYRRDEEGTCIPIGECPGICPVTEEFSNCTQALCRAQNCAQKGLPLACPGIAEGSCEKGCVCSTGFLRNAEGNCVTDDQCPGELVCDDNEVAIASRTDATNDYCPRFEGDKGEISGNMSEAEEPVCVCRFNYKRNYENGKCIPTVDCPPFECNRPYEEYRSCPPWCPSDDCSQATPTGRCQIYGRIGIVLECNPTCRCIEGYWRDNGTCVPYAACPGKCPTNERYSSCIQGECRALNCTQKGKSIACPRLIPGACKNGCVCVEGTLRADNGSCIPEKECPVCPVNEEFSNCTQAICRQQTCKDKKLPLSCSAINEGDCNSGCICQSGYLRTEEGECVPQNQCSGDLVCKTNEVVDNCPNSCHGDCCPKSEKDAKLRKQSKVITECEEQSCTCRFNYLRADNGTCIPARDCPPFNCTGENEEFNPCPPFCPTDDCAQATPSGRCPLPGRIGIVLQCRPDCRCKTGFWRKNGVCVPYSECPGICPVNEEYSDCIQGVCRALNCTQKGKPIACAGIAEGSCEKGCICSTGFLRDEDGNCIPEDKCQAGICSDNEEFSNCTQALCRAQNCTQKGKPIACAGIAEGSCEKGCVCLNGFLRDADGNCIPDDQCPAPKCHGQNEVLEECPNGCAPINCPESLKEEQERLANCVSIAACLSPDCRCRPDYRRDKEGRCIHIGECPGICPKNEEFSSCTQGLCRAQKCTQKGKPIACPDIDEGFCDKGCVCSTGFLRDEYGNCVPDHQCPAPQQPQCRENEVLRCVHECPPERTCRNRGIQFSCIEPTKKCENKCICKKGYYKNYLGDCITGKQCDQCSGPNEFFSCGSACDNECKTWGTQNRTNCPIVNVVCNPSCYCEDGYARNERKQCIPVEECPKPNLCCGPNEEYVNCKKTCPPEVCFSLVARFKCPGNPKCEPGCACKPGYLRKEDGSQCVPICDCPEMKGSQDCKKQWPNSKY